MSELHFETRNALARLPWFEEHRGELVLSEQGLGPIIDVHTHYALPSLRLGPEDMTRETPDSDLLLGRCCAHHLDRYANECFTPTELDAMRRELVWGALRKKGRRTNHTAPNLSRDMKSMGIAHALVLGIDMGLVSSHPGYTLEVARTRPDHTPFGSVHPRSLRARQKFEEQLHAGAKGIKIHPNNQLTRPDAPGAMRIYQWCGEVGIPVFWHCGPAGIEPKLGQYCGQVRFYEKPIREFPRTQFVLGHSGAKQHAEAIALYQKYPNAWLDISCISLKQLEDVLAADPSRILFGSDWPFYHPVLPLAKLLMVTEERKALRPKILHENAERLMSMTRVK